MATNSNDPNVNININANNQTDQATNEVNNNLSSIGENVKKLAIVGVMAAALKELVGGLFDLAKEGAQASEQADKLAIALKNNSGGSQEMTDALIEQATALQQVTGYGGDEIVNAQTRLALTKLNAEQIRLLTPALLDTAEGLRNMGEENADLNSIADIFSKALDGNEKSLKKLKVSLSPVESELFKTGTTTERVQLLTEKLGESFGGMADEQGKKFTQTLSIAEQAAGDFQETLGNQIAQNEAVLDSILKTADGWQDLTDTVEENKDVIGASINATIAVFVSFGNTVKAIFNGLEVGVKGAALVVVESLVVISKGMEKVTFGKASENWKKETQQLQEISTGLKESIQDDFQDVDKALNGIANPLDSIKSKGKQTSKEITEAAKEATKAAANAEDEIRVKKEEAYKADKELRDQQITDIKAAEEEKIRQIKGTGDSIKAQDDAILAEKITNAAAISNILTQQLAADKGALIAYTGEKKNFTAEELTAAKTSLTDIEKSARDHYKTLITLADEHKNKAIAAQKEIENQTKTAEEKIREIRRAGLSDEAANADRQSEIDEKLVKVRELAGQGQFQAAADLGKELQGLAASQAQSAAADAKKTGDTYAADVALSKYQQTVNATKEALTGLAQEENKKSQQATQAAAQPKATADTAAQQITAVNDTLQNGKPLQIVPDVAPAVAAIQAEIAKIPETKTIHVLFDNEGRKIGYSELLTNQNLPQATNQAATQTAQTTGQTNQPLKPVEVPVKGDINVNVSFIGLDKLEPLVKQWALDAAIEQIKIERRSGQ